MSLRVLSIADLPAAKMERVIVHWTAGTYQVSDTDREHYHFLVDGDGAVVRGFHSVKANQEIKTGEPHAAHTWHKNTGSIGIAACCMLGAQEKGKHAFEPGSHPMKKSQWEKLAEVAADLCEHYNIPVTRATVLGHGEVEKNIGVTQRGKWDPMALPWDPSFQSPAKYSAVGDLFRERVRAALKATPDIEKPLEVKLLLNNDFFPAILEDGSSWGAIRKIADNYGWKIVKTTKTKAFVLIGNQTHELDFLKEGTIGYVQLIDLAKALDLQISWDAISRTIKLD